MPSLLFLPFCTQQPWLQCGPSSPTQSSAGSTAAGRETAGEPSQTAALHTNTLPRRSWICPEWRRSSTWEKKRNSCGCSAWFPALSSSYIVFTCHFLLSLCFVLYQSSSSFTISALLSDQCVNRGYPSNCIFSALRGGTSNFTQKLYNKGSTLCHTGSIDPELMIAINVDRQIG